MRRRPTEVGPGAESGASHPVVDRCRVVAARDFSLGRSGGKPRSSAAGSTSAANSSPGHKAGYNALPNSERRPAGSTICALPA
ncbi:MAG: hypothetical protein WCA89_01410 [Terracidiphilus sp.]